MSAMNTSATSVSQTPVRDEDVARPGEIDSPAVELMREK
jgi:hypothetical protein